MKFRITKEKFLDGLQQVQNVVSSRATLPILSNVLLERKDGVLSLTARGDQPQRASSVGSVPLACSGGGGGAPTAMHVSPA
jgi:hypothetical protein